MSNQERRKALRRPIIDSFSLFVSIPKKGPYRLKVHDLSEIGIGFDLDIDEENPADSPLEKGDKLDVEFYLNQSLSISLKVEIMRIDLQKNTTVRKAGALFSNANSPASLHAIETFVHFLDQLQEIAKVAP